MASLQDSNQTLKPKSVTMGRENQICLTEAIVAVIEFGSIVVIKQRARLVNSSGPWISRHSRPRACRSVGMPMAQAAQNLRVA